MSATTPKFFGLTALGAPDPWHTKLADTVLLDIFTDADVENAYAKVELPDGGVMLEGASSHPPPLSCESACLVLASLVAAPSSCPCEKL